MDTKITNAAPTMTPTVNTSSIGTTSADGVPKSKRAAREKAAEESRANGLPSTSDFDVNVSSRAREVADSHRKALEIARSTPDVREDRVADIKKRIQDGTYKVDSGKVADGMMREALLDHLAQHGEE